MFYHLTFMHIVEYVGIFLEFFAIHVRTAHCLVHYKVPMSSAFLRPTTARESLTDGFLRLRKMALRKEAPPPPLPLRRSFLLAAGELPAEKKPAAAMGPPRSASCAASYSSREQEDDGDGADGPGGVDEDMTRWLDVAEAAAAAAAAATDVAA